MTLDFNQIENMVKKKTLASGNLHYRYPGQLVDSDYEYNAADLEDYFSHD